MSRDCQFEFLFYFAAHERSDSKAYHIEKHWTMNDEIDIWVIIKQLWLLLPQALIFWLISINLSLTLNVILVDV